MSSNPNTKLAIHIFGGNRTVGYMIVNSLKLTCKLERKDKYYIKHIKKLKIAMIWAITSFKALILFPNLSPWAISSFNSRIHVSKYRKYGQNVV